MPNYKFTAVNQAGEKISSKIEADDAVLAQEMLRTQGYTMIENIKEESLFDKDLNFNFGKKKVTARDLSVFCRQFVSITTAGVTIVDALEMLAMQTENPTLQAAIMDTSTSVKKGETLANGLKRQGTDIFPTIMINMVEAGEASGNLETAFDRVGVQFEKQQRLNGLVKKSLMYPIALVVIIIAVVAAMMILVIPTFSDMYADMDQKLPAITQLLVNISDFLVAKWYIVIIAVVAIVVGIKLFKSTEIGTYFFGKISMKMPIFGTLTVKSESANFARTLSTLTASGIAMIDALEITAKTMKNPYFKDAVMEAKEKVAQGRPLSEPLEASGVFPKMIVHMIGIGEETGNMEDMLNTAASYYEEEVEVTTQSVTALIEPLIVVVMAGIVGTIIMAILIPMFGMYSLADGEG